MPISPRLNSTLFWLGPFAPITNPLLRVDQTLYRVRSADGFAVFSESMPAAVADGYTVSTLAEAKVDHG